jgi:hypothetical protein
MQNETRRGIYLYTDSMEQSLNWETSSHSGSKKKKKKVAAF